MTIKQSNSEYIPTDIDLALREMTETEDDISLMEISPLFRRHLERIRSDVGASPFVNLTDNMIKWVILAHTRALGEQAEKQQPIGWLFPEGLAALKMGMHWSAYGTKQGGDCSIPIYLNDAVAPNAEQAPAGGVAHV